MNPSGGPRGQADGAARAGDPDDLVRGPLMIGREHRPEDAQHRVEGPVLHGQVFGVAEPELDVEALGHRARASVLEQSGNVVDAEGVGAGAGRRQGGVAVAARDIQHLPACLQVGRVGQQLAGQHDARGDDGIVAAGPGLLLARLDDRQVRTRRCRSHNDSSSSGPGTGQLR